MRCLETNAVCTAVPCSAVYDTHWVSWLLVLGFPPEMCVWLNEGKGDEEGCAHGPRGRVCSWLVVE